MSELSDNLESQDNHNPLTPFSPIPNQALSQWTADLEY